MVNADFEDYWIGANDEVVEGEWRWVSDNSAVQYTNWLLGGDPGNTATKDCVYMSDVLGGTWEVRACTAKWFFFCEWGP